MILRPVLIPMAMLLGQLSLASPSRPTEPPPPDTAVARIVGLVNVGSVAALVNGLQAFGTRLYTQPNRYQVFDWVGNMFLQSGITSVTYDSFAVGAFGQANVVATIPGTVAPDRQIIVGGHLDSYSSSPTRAPGADDNATGTAAAIEMARVLRAAGYQPSLTLKFIGFAAEEGGLLGSQHYAQLIHGVNTDVRMMMNFDMIGHRDLTQSLRDFFIVTYSGSEQFSNFQALMASTYTTLVPVLTTLYRGGSDSWSFHAQGYHTTFSIETNFSPQYHSPSDSAVYLDFEYAADIIRTGLATLLTLDQVPPAPASARLFDRGDGSQLLLCLDPAAIPDRSTYIVERYHGGSFDTSFAATLDTIPIVGLVEGTTYDLMVRAVDLVGLESPTIVRSETPSRTPRRPAGLAARLVQSRVLLTWAPAIELDLAKYRLYRGTSTDTAYNLCVAVAPPDTEWLDSLPGSPLVSYYLRAIDTTGLESPPSDTVQMGIPASVEESLPQSFGLAQNYPNPFNPSTTIAFDLPNATHVSLRVYSFSGTEVATLLDEVRPAGHHTVTWDAAARPGGCASGIYFCRLQTSSGTFTRKMALIK